MGEKIQRVDPFRLLLNEISYQLTDEDVQRLIYIYGAPGSVKKKVNDSQGLAFFDYLITQDYISHSKIGNLHYLLRKIKRNDLVLRVEKYIEKEFQTNNVQSVIGELSGSWEAESKSGSLVTVLPANDKTSDQTAFTCKTDCACFLINCVCRRVPSCYAPTIALLLIAIIATTVFWYADVPKISNSINSNSELKSAGVYILVLEILALLVVIGLRIRKKLASFLASRKHNYDIFPNTQEGTSQQMVSVIGTDSFRRSSRRYKVSASESGIFSGASGTVSSFSGSTISEPMDELPDSSGAEAQVINNEQYFTSHM
jgi:hypothetical protein